MKKLSVLFVALAVAMSASAAGQFKANVRNSNLNKIVKHEMTKQDLMQAKKAARVMTEDPEGEAYDFQRAGGGVYVESGYLTLGDQAGNKARFVFDADGTTVYVRDLLFGAGSYFGHAWVQGTIEGDVLTVPMGQSIYWSDQYQADVVLAWGTTNAVYNEETQNYQIGFTRDESVTAVTYTIDRENQTYTLNGTVAPEATDASDVNAYLGTGLTAYWTDDNSWSGCIEWNTVFSDPAEPAVAPTLITEQPEGQLYTYLRSGYCIYSSIFGVGTTEQDGKMNVVFGEDGKVFIQNPMWWHDGNNTWVEGTYDWMTGLITIPVGQYLSWNEEYEYGVQMMWGSTYVYQDVDENGEPANYLGSALDEEAEAVYFMIDDDVIGLMGSEGDYEAEGLEAYEATGLYSMWSDDQTWAGSLEYKTLGKIVNVVPAVPADPTADEWYDCGDESGFSRFYFTLPSEDIDGNAIDTDYLSYSIYTDDDQLFTFPAADYTFDLTEDITEVPAWLFNDAVDFHDYYCYFYRTNAEGYEPLFTRRIGIQVTYTVEAPEAPETAGAPNKAMVANKSNIVYLDVFTGINDVKTDAQVNGPVYNLMGQKMNGSLPAGIYIQNGKKFIVK